MTLALCRNAKLAILKGAGIQCSHGTPSTEAAARTVDVALLARPELGVGIQSFLMHSGVTMTPSHSSVFGHPGEVRTTTNGGVLRLLARP